MKKIYLNFMDFKEAFPFLLSRYKNSCRFFAIFLLQLKKSI